MNPKKLISAVMLLALVSCSSKTENNSKAEAQVIAAASGKTVSIVELARANNLEQIAKSIRTTEESKVQRHPATTEIVLRLLSNIEPNTLKLGPIHFYPDRALVIVNIEEPVRVELEYYVDASSENQLRLQSIHP